MDKMMSKRVVISLGYDEITGKRIRETGTVYGRNVTELRIEEEKYRYEVRKKPRTKYNEIKTMGKLIEKWQEITDKNRERSTNERYRKMLEGWVIPVFGKKKVEKITPLMIETFLFRLSEDGVRKDGQEGGYADKTIHNYYTLLSAIFSQGVRWDVISKNPVNRVNKPKVNKTNVYFYDVEQVEKLFTIISKEDTQEQYKIFVHLAITTGCRLSELMGFQWDDIDWENGVIHLRRVSIYSQMDNAIYTKDVTKNGEPSRTITLIPQVIPMLKKYRKLYEKEKKEYGTGWVESNRLFIAANGRVMNHSQPATWLKRLLKKHNMPHISIHGLRHTNISLDLLSGTDIVTASAEKGHDPTMMLKTYAHALKKPRIEAAARLGNLLYE